MYNSQTHGAIATTDKNCLSSFGQAEMEDQAPQEFAPPVDPIAAKLRLNNSWRIREGLNAGELYFQKKQSFKKLKEFKKWLEEQGFTWKNACKFLKMYETFAEFSLEQIEWVDINTLFQLMQPRYKELLEQLRKLPKWIYSQVVELMQQFRELKKENAPKPQPEEGGWIRFPVGVRAFKLPLLYDEETGIKILQLVKLKNSSIRQIIKEAIAMLLKSEEEKQIKCMSESRIDNALQSQFEAARLHLGREKSYP